jgi:hypothetical protein
MSRNNAGWIREGAVFWGFIWGLIAGGAAAVFYGPRFTLTLGQEHLNEIGQGIRERIEEIVPEDPVAESMAEGKAAARRRMAELGQTNDPSLPPQL